MPPRVNPGVLSARDAAALNAWVEKVERSLLRPGAGGAGTQTAGGTFVPRPPPREGFWAELTEVGDYIPAGGSGTSGSGPVPPAGCAPAYSWREWWDNEEGCLVRRPDGLFGLIDPSHAAGALLPAFDVNGGVTDLPCVTWLRPGRNSPFWYFDRALIAAGGSGSGATTPLKVSDIIQCTPEGFVRDGCLEIINGRLVLTDCHGRVIGGNPGVGGGTGGAGTGGGFA